MKNVQPFSVLLCLILLTAVGKANLYNNGEANNIDFEIPGPITIENSQYGHPTTVNLLAGGSIGGIAYPTHASVFNIYDGSVYGIDAQSISEVNLLGGSVGGGRLKAWGGTRVMISGGNVSDITVSFDNSQLTITGGSVGQVESYSPKPIVVSGGIVSGPLLLAGPAESIQAEIFGTGFRIDGVPVDYGVIPAVNPNSNGWNDEPFRTLSGTLLDGREINIEFKMLRTSLQLIPEPATGGLLLLAWSVVLRRRTL